jgi:hypothetical protein
VSAFEVTPANKGVTIGGMTYGGTYTMAHDLSKLYTAWGLIVACLIVLVLFIGWARPFGLVGLILSW